MKKYPLTTAHTLILLLILMLFACHYKHGHLVLTFDDDNIAEWYAARDLFNEYGIRATFFIVRPHKLDSLQIQQLQILQKEGHEIGCHTLTHKNAITYCDTSSIQNYIMKEVIPAVQILDHYGFKAISFAYPNGQSTPEIDSALLQYFLILRKATYNIEDTTIDCIGRTYSDGNSRIIDAMGIDVIYKITPENLETGFRRISQTGESLVLHAHEINDSGGNYTTSRAYLEEVFRLCKKYRVRSITCSELLNYKK
jgi:peptidoglycan/xylan/chitin deacetylase (PgdA/CDA1 family)